MIRRGFAIVEVLFILALLGVFSLMATRLFYASFSVMQSAARTTDDATRFDAAMAAMRHDVFLCDSIQMLDPNSVEIRRSNDAPVRWQTDGTQLQRTAGQNQRRWAIGQKIQLHLQGPILLIRPEIGGELAMASALEIAK